MNGLWPVDGRRTKDRVETTTTNSHEKNGKKGLRIGWCSKSEENREGMRCLAGRSRSSPHSLVNTIPHSFSTTTDTISIYAQMARRASLFCRCWSLLGNMRCR